jgi:hypothetical protein
MCRQALRTTVICRRGKIEAIVLMTLHVPYPGSDWPPRTKRRETMWRQCD